MGEVGTGRLLVFDGNSLSIIIDIDNEERNYLPDSFTLFQNFPNPFNPNTRIAYSIPKDVHITLKFFNLFGNEIKL